MISGRSPAIAIAIIVVAILIWLTGCTGYLSTPELNDALKACRDGGGHVTEVSDNLVRREYGFPLKGNAQ